MKLSFHHTCSHFPLPLVALFLLLSMLLMCPVQVFSADSFLVRSEYYDLQEKNWQNSRYWNFLFADNARMTVSLGTDDTPLLELQLDATGVPVTLHTFLKRGGQTVSLVDDVSGPVLLSAGFPVPYDYLSPLNETEHLEGVTSFTSAGQTFTAEITRTLSWIPYRQAVSEGMIDQSLLTDNAAEDLKLITVYKSDELQVQQLWRQGDMMWLYESTPLRRSWRFVSN